MKNFRKLLFISIAFIAFSCSENDPAPFIQQPLELGVLVLHEGQFLAGNASLSAYAFDGGITNDIFSTFNGRPLGDVAQSMAFEGNDIFIVVNNSQKVEVLDKVTLQSRATIDSGLLNPRYMAFLGNRGYITNWGDGLNATDDYVAIVDLDTYEVIDQIPVVEGPEQIVSDGSQLYVAHEGGFSQNDKITVISADQSTQVLTVGDVPNSIELGPAGNLWVLCGGIPAFTGNETAGSLYVVELPSLNVDLRTTFGQTDHPNNMSLDGANLYYQLNGTLYQIPADDTLRPAFELFGGVNYYGMLVHNNLIYGADAGDFTNPGTFEIRAMDGSLIDEEQVGVVPSKIYPYTFE